MRRSGPWRISCLRHQLFLLVVVSGHQSSDQVLITPQVGVGAPLYLCHNPTHQLHFRQEGTSERRPEPSAPAWLNFH